MRPGHTCIVLFVVFLLVSFLFFHKPFPFGQDLVLMKTGIVQLIAYVPQTRVIPQNIRVVHFTLQHLSLIHI